MNILISAASTALAFKIAKLLENHSVVLADSVELPGILVKNKRFARIPPGDSPSFSHQLLSLCLDLEIDVVFPLRKAEVIALSEARQLFDEYGIRVMLPEPALAAELSDTPSEGEIVVRGLSEEGGEPKWPGRGVFLYSQRSEPEFRLLTVD